MNNLPDDQTMLRPWFEQLEGEARKFCDAVCSIDASYADLLFYKDRIIIDGVFSKYKQYRDKLHKLHAGGLIDRHKILAAIVLAFTDEGNQPFAFNEDALKKLPKDARFNWRLTFPNEMFISFAVTSFLSEFILATSKIDSLGLNKNNYDIRFPDKIKCWKTGKAFQYEFHFSQLLANMIQEKDYSTKCLLVMSHLSLFYEIAYDCGVQGLNGEYYAPTVNTIYESPCNASVE